MSHGIKIFNPHMHKFVPQGPKHYILVTTFTQKIPESSDSMYSSILRLYVILLLIADGIHKNAHQWNKIHNIL